MPRPSLTPLHAALALLVMAITGEQFRGHQAGAGASAAADLRGVAVRAGGVSGAVLRQAADDGVADAGALWRADRGGAVRGALYRHAWVDLAGPGLAGDPDAGV